MTKDRRPITIDDLWSMKRIGPTTLSPDGRWACAAVTSYSMDTNESTSQLWLFATDGTTQRQLTRGAKDADPQWSPDGRYLAFTSKRDKGEGKSDEEPQLWLIAADGGEAMKVTDLATGVSSLRWFPDSQRIAFVSWVWPDLAGTKAQAKRMKVERDDKVKAYAIENNHYRYWDHWLPRGRRPHVHVATLPMASIEGGLSADAAIRDLFEGTSFHLPPQEPDAALFDISPDGAELAFTFDFDPDPRAPSMTDLVLMDVKKGKWTSPTRASGRADEQPRYSPDGRWIAFHSSNLVRAHNEEPRLALLRRRDKTTIPLTYAWDRGLHGPVRWSHDSKRILFLAEDEIAQPIWSIDVPTTDDAAFDPGMPREVLRGPLHGGVATDLAVGSDGSVLTYARSSQTHPPTLFACDADGGRERAIEALNAPLLERLRFAETHSLTIAGFEGDPVQMWVITPPGFELEPPGKQAKKDTKKRAKPGKQWPLMHNIHGGPHTCSNDAWHWRWNTQLFAARGYVVASVNYHGSTGWGQAFVGSINGDWGRRELADVEAGTEYLLATGRIDPQRVTATGGSYGGYMVALMNGRAVRNRYAAYVCHAGCYDWVSMMGSDGYFWFGHELGGFPWEDEARVLAQSPHHYAAAFETPTLVIHGELDYRVPYYQGLAYYNTLRVKRVPSRLLCYPDENHWILKPQNSRLWYREFFDWLERHAGAVKGKGKAH
jgi:dipeptidyl aminopeptidase/acylaminoacyl peptidase